MQETGPHHVGRPRHRDRGAGTQHQSGNLCFRHQLRDRQRRRRDADSDQSHLVVNDHVLDDAARIVGDAAIVTNDELELTPGDVGTVLLDVKLERARELPADGVEAGPGQRNADAHFQDIVGGGPGGAHTDGGGGRQSLEHSSAQHHGPSPQFLFFMKAG